MTELSIQAWAYTFWKEIDKPCTGLRRNLAIGPADTATAVKVTNDAISFATSIQVTDKQSIIAGMKLTRKQMLEAMLQMEAAE